MHTLQLEHRGYDWSISDSLHALVIVVIPVFFSLLFLPPFHELINYVGTRFHVFGIGQHSVGFSIRIEVKTDSKTSVRHIYIQFLYEINFTFFMLWFGYFKLIILTISWFGYL